MKQNKGLQVISVLLLILVLITAKKHPSKSSDKCNIFLVLQYIQNIIYSEQYLQQSVNKDVIAKEMFIGVAKSFNISLPQNIIDSVTYENWSIEELETALNNFGAVMMDQSYLKETLFNLRTIFSNFGKALPKSEETDRIINSFLKVFSDEETFNSIKVKLYEDKNIDCQLYLWGSLDYIIFDQYQVIGETFGKVVYLMSQYLQ